MPRRIKEFACRRCEVNLKVAWKDSVNHYLNWCPVCGSQQGSFNPVRDVDPEDFDNFVRMINAGKRLTHKTEMSIGTLNVFDANIEKDETYISVDYLLKNICPPLKIVLWSDVTKAATKYVEQTTGVPTFSFNEMRIESAARYYCKHLAKGWTTESDEPYFIGKDGTSNTINDNNYYYRAAKLHWLLCNVAEEGFWFPSICKLWLNNGKPVTQWHPGTGRAKVIHALENEVPTKVMVYDKENLIDHPRATMSDVVSFWREVIDKKYPTRYETEDSEVRFTYRSGTIEIYHRHQVGRFKKSITEFNREACMLSDDKTINVYIGYDSRHKGLEDLCNFAIQTGQHHGFSPEIKILKHQDIEEYTRPYADQSTEFTYSRFLVPYLENYEGYSIFTDDDIIFTEGELLTLFLHLNPKDAVACVQYPYFDANQQKFHQAKNTSYAKKLWSSLMIFNNSHPDCKKLTPELINTATGKYLHQFEWTDQISSIPDKYILTSGYDNNTEKPDHLAVHYTNGGPWVQDQWTEGMNLQQYDKMYKKYKRAKRWLYNPKK